METDFLGLDFKEILGLLKNYYGYIFALWTFGFFTIWIFFSVQRLLLKVDNEKEGEPLKNGSEEESEEESYLSMIFGRNLSNQRVGEFSINVFFAFLLVLAVVFTNSGYLKDSFKID